MPATLLKGSNVEIVRWGYARRAVPLEASVLTANMSDVNASLLPMPLHGFVAARIYLPAALTKCRFHLNRMSLVPAEPQASWLSCLMSSMSGVIMIFLALTRFVQVQPEVE